MMYLDVFHTNNNHTVQIAAKQASRFAKEVAGDFNPIHNPDSKRFCVPGDLLFSLVLAKYGISKKMCFVFKGMVGDNTALNFTPSDSGEFDITDAKDKVYLSVKREGDNTDDADLIEQMTQNYVAFSGESFPHTLAPLLAKHDVMLNADRPLVIYERMQFELEHLDFTNPELELSEAKLDVNGKRGEANLHFYIKSEGEIVGTGFKKLLLSGLRPHEEESAERLTAEYLSWKNNYKKS